MTIGATQRCAGQFDWANNAIVLDADGDGLRVAESMRRRMAARAGIVIVQSGDCVKPQQAPHIGQLLVEATAAWLRVDSIRPVKPARGARPPTVDPMSRYPGRCRDVGPRRWTSAEVVPTAKTTNRTFATMHRLDMNSLLVRAGKSRPIQNPPDDCDERSQRSLATVAQADRRVSTSVQTLDGIAEQWLSPGVPLQEIGQRKDIKRAIGIRVRPSPIEAHRQMAQRCHCR